MTVLHTGSNQKFASGWEGIFTKGKKASAGKAKAGAKTTAKQGGKKAAPKKKAKR